jgi:hypothetical protein
VVCHHLYPSVNLGKLLHPLLKISLLEFGGPHNGSSKTTSASYPWISKWTKILWLSRSHLQDNFDSRRGFWTEILSRRSNSLLDNRMHRRPSSPNSGFVPTNLNRNYQCTTKIHTVKKRDEGITSRHCGGGCSQRQPILSTVS